MGSPMIGTFALPGAGSHHSPHRHALGPEVLRRHGPRPRTARQMPGVDAERDRGHSRGHAISVPLPPVTGGHGHPRAVVRAVQGGAFTNPQLPVRLPASFRSVRGLERALARGPCSSEVPEGRSPGSLAGSQICSRLLYPWAHIPASPCSINVNRSVTPQPEPHSLVHQGTRLSAMPHRGPGVHRLPRGGPQTASAGTQRSSAFWEGCSPRLFRRAHSPGVRRSHSEAGARLVPP